MNESRLTAKVGAFAGIGLILLVVLLLSFSKGLRFAATYPLLLRATTVAGLKSGSLVLMSGVRIGTVVKAEVAPDGRGVIIHLKINQKYFVHADARFVIEQIGFLGDQYIAIYPQENKKPILQAGAEVACEEPFNIQEVVRSGAGLIRHLDQTVEYLNDAMERLDQTVLSENTLTNLDTAIVNFRALSDQTLVLSRRVNALVQTNATPISMAVSNLVRVTEDSDQLVGEIRETVATNRGEVTALLKNLDSLAQRLDTLAKNLETGKGLAGALLSNDQLKTNAMNTVASLATLTSNLNEFGLLYKPKRRKASAAEHPLVAPKFQP